MSQFRERGLVIKDWAASHGFHHEVVYAVLAGRSKCLRGQSHRVAVALGLKPSLDQGGPMSTPPG
ncbi:DNA-binding protein [Piscinibacter sp. HJYY11]|nr:DNA-binding protein [Piscinibacter sp. HJYY11]